MNGVAEAFDEIRSLPVSSAILDAAGTIVAVNQAWKDFGRKNGLRVPSHGVGSSYLKYCESVTENRPSVAGQVRDLIAGRLDLLTLVYPCDSATEKRWFVLIGVPLSTDWPTGVALLHVNLTEILPVPLAARSIRIGMVRTARDPAANSPEVAGESVRHSVAQALSSELMAMFKGVERVPKSAPAAPDGADPRLASAGLSRRQVQVFRLLGEGMTNEQIAKQLFRSPNTIKLHVSAILQRLDLKNRTQAALLASQIFWPRSTE